MNGFPNYQVYVAGFCLNQPGPGGYAVMALAENPEDQPQLPRIKGEILGGDAWTTVNRLELTAILAVLRNEPEEWRQLPLTIHAAPLLSAAADQEPDDTDLWDQIHPLLAERPGQANLCLNCLDDETQSKTDQLRRSARHPATTARYDGMAIPEGSGIYRSINQQKPAAASPWVEMQSA